MAWVETHSLSFLARHERDDEDCAQRTLDRLEDLRLGLEERFERAPGEITVIVHPTPGWLSAAHPFLPAARWAAAPAGRRYLAGWAMATELHVLNDHYTDRRAAGDDSRRALRGTAERLYVQIVLGANNDRLPPPWGPRRFGRYLRWAWLIEGAAQYFSGQVPLFRPAVIRRMREGPSPSFPPSPRDAIILGGTVFDLLEREVGPEACELLVSRLRKDGAQGNLELAFDARLRDIERSWRRHLREEAGPRASA
ncbi:MAG TPA: hypothetical protein VHI76_00640 [Solirubrobacterales bacterium]|jgi:hypothetical protein|nr:hypothetical protein [Solirubrobacterales bacterium]